MLNYRVTPWLLTPVLAWLLGCGDSGGGKGDKTTDTNDGTTTESNAECSEDAMRCAEEQVAQKCVFGRWSDWDDCGAKGQSCVMSKGTAVCEDEAGTDETETHSGTASDTGSESGTGTSSETGTESDTNFDTDFDDPGCPDGQWPSCYGDDVWCMDLSATPISLLKDCLEAEHCEPGSPATCGCTPVWTIQCYGGDVWSYSSCTGRGARLEDCEAFEACVNTGGPTVECRVTECANVDDFTPCALVTVPDRLYDICVSGQCVSPGCGDMSCNVPGPHFSLSDTNQRVCYDASVPVTCPSAGQSFDGQDAQYGWDVTHLENERYNRTTPVTNQPIVEDNVTGLVWQGCAAGRLGTNCSAGSASAVTWSDAVVTCDSLTWGGYADWRLPDPYELSSIVDSGTLSPAIHTMAFPGTPDDWFWSSSSSANYSNFAWNVSFGYGAVGLEEKFKDYRVRCVRSGPFHARHFESLTLLDDRMVSDNVTGLEWQGCAAGLSGATCAEGSATAYSWSAALSYCEGQSYGGHTDWRLPNRAELQSIVDQRTLSPAIDAVAFPGTPSAYFWSSSSLANYLYGAWVVHFSEGHMDSNGKDDGARVRCVRSGP